MSIKGYKVFNPDWTCRGFKYEVGKTYEHNGNIGLCKAGFHFCRKASDCFNYYSFDSRNHVAEVEAIGLVETNDDKSVTDKIHIVREIPWNELLTIVNEGKGCTGLRNTGNRNTGNLNTGDFNTGLRNTGNRNTGNLNTGDFNTGLRNTGDFNTGNLNTGDFNTGDFNTGNRNTGNLNTGDRNTGDRNTGDFNTGDFNTGNLNTGDFNTGLRNTGDWNAGDFNTGFFCTDTPTIRAFNRQTNLTRDEFIKSIGLRVLSWNYENNFWIYSVNMTDEEKAEHPEHETTGGYLKVLPFQEACNLMWDRLDADDKQAVKDIPYFDAEVFEEITGIDVKGG